MSTFHRLHQELLAVAEEISAAKAACAALDEEAARVATKRREAAEHLEALMQKHLDLITGAAMAGNAVSEPTPVPLPLEGDGFGFDPPAPKMTRMKRVLILLATNGPMLARDIATSLDEDPKLVYTALQDMKRRRNLLDGPVNGKWSISEAGTEEIRSEQVTKAA